jgi:hypothetical protein
MEDAIQLTHCLDRDRFVFPALTLHQNNVATFSEHQVDAAVCADGESFLHAIAQPTIGLRD